MTLKSAASSSRNGFDDSSLAVGVRFQRGQYSAGRGRTRGALLVIHRFVRALGRLRVLNQTLTDVHAGRSPFKPRIYC